MDYKKLRQTLELTQAQFGRLLGYINPQIRVSELESGRQHGSPQVQAFVAFLSFLIENGEKQQIINWLHEHN